ncbi:MAG: hypothetical protein HQ523_09520 [Lentisphaerae bacterium]|nr:hypothetical protein [Lentisphaerota bacterium]
MKPHASLVTLLVSALLFTTAAQADIISATMKFTDAHELLAHADRARDEGAKEEALALYKRSLNTYTELATQDPDFQPEMVEFRMEYCDGQIAAMLAAYYPSTNATPMTVVSAPSVVDEALALDAPTAQADDRRIEELLIGARSKLEQGEAEAARDLLLKGFEVDPDNVALRLLAGLAQCQARKFGDAIYLLGELANEQPSNAAVHVSLAAACFGSGDSGRAQMELETAVRLEPDMADAHYNLAQLLLTTPTPDLDAVDRHYRRARHLGTPPDLRVESALKESGPGTANQ